jgi:dienelactone hydrolase
MAEIVLFHSALGLRAGVTAGADRLRAAGHTVHVPDLYDGQVFDDYATAGAWLEAMGGFPELMDRMGKAVVGLSEAVVYAGFSNGGAGAEWLAATRPGARGAVLLHAALPLAALGVPAWPAGVPVQVHYATGDPFRDSGSIDALAAAVRASGAPYEFCEYPAAGHLITDPSLPTEYDESAAQALFDRVLSFLRRIDAG